MEDKYFLDSKDFDMCCTCTCLNIGIILIGESGL